jgi:hypothetical protein
MVFSGAVRLGFRERLLLLIRARGAGPRAEHGTHIVREALRLFGAGASRR